MNIYFQNMSGMWSKLPQVRAAVTTSNYDVIVLIETWLKPDIKSEEIFDDDWVVFRCDRAETEIEATEGGGVLIAIKKIFGPTLIPNASNTIEQVWVELDVSKNKFIIGAVYLQPQAPVETYASFADSTKNLLAKFENVETSTLILGDFNLPDIN